MQVKDKPVSIIAVDVMETKSLLVLWVVIAIQVHAKSTFLIQTTCRKRIERRKWNIIACNQRNYNHIGVNEQKPKGNPMSLIRKDTITQLHEVGKKKVKG